MREKIGVNRGREIVEQDAPAVRQALQLTSRGRLGDIKESKGEEGDGKHPELAQAR